MSASPGITTVSLDVQRHDDDAVFPLIYTSENSDITIDQTVDWVEGNRDQLLSQATKHGAVAFRGLPTPTVETFDRFIRGLKLENFPYKKSLSNAVRINRTERVFSANEAPPDVRIYFHHEMAQTPLYPRYIMFFCEVAPQVGGATPLCRSDILYARLQERCPEFAEKCERTGLKYTNVMPGVDDPNSGMGRSWQSTLGVDTKQAAEARLAELGYSFEWLQGDCLRATTPQLPAVKEISPGRKSFFNQLIAAYCGWSDDRNDPSKAIRHGDGTILDADAVQVAIDLSEELAYDHQWHVGDIVILDNTVAMHARRPFEGTRKVVASLAEMQTHAFVEAG
jgi:alpha-ketoglutarate-dependent taurine dioxygenase